MASVGLDGCGVGVSQFSKSLHHPQIPPGVLLPNMPLPSSITKGLHPSWCGHLLAFIFLTIPPIAASSQAEAAPWAAAASGSCPSLGSWKDGDSAPKGERKPSPPSPLSKGVTSEQGTWWAAPAGLPGEEALAPEQRGQIVLWLLLQLTGRMEKKLGHAHLVLGLWLHKPRGD